MDDEFMEPRSDDEVPMKEDLDFIVPDDEVEVEVEIAYEVSEQMEKLTSGAELEELGPIVESKRQRFPPATNIYDENRDEMRPLVLGDDAYSLNSSPPRESVITAEWYPPSGSSSEDEFEC
jgi:hypothetical protein